MELILFMTVNITAKKKKSTQKKKKVSNES